MDSSRVARLPRWTALLSTAAAVALVWLAGIGATAKAGQSAAAALNFGDAAQWQSEKSKSLPRQSDTQLMIIDVLDIDVPGQLQARVDPHPPAIRGLADFWNVSGEPVAFSSGPRPIEAVWLYPLTGTGIQGVTRATRVHAYLTSLGTSTGEAFDIEIVNDGTAPVRISGDGVVVEPVKKGSEKALRSELQQTAVKRPATVAKANAYCLEFKLKPPDAGNMFRVSDASTQQKYSAAREILRASRRLQDNGQLAADSNPNDYFHAIRQWAIWANEQRFTLASYRDAFIERSRKNAKALGQQWSQALEDGLKALVPHRWDEINKILREAKQPVRGA